MINIIYRNYYIKVFIGIFVYRMFIEVYYVFILILLWEFLREIEGFFFLYLGLMLGLSWVRNVLIFCLLVVLGF